MEDTTAPCSCASAEALPDNGSVFNSPITRRRFFSGMAAVTGTVLWASSGAERAGAATVGSISVGRGLGDMTGEPWGAGMNGYAVLEQSSIGLQRRQYARAFIFVDPATNERVVEVIADIGLMFQSIFLEVVRRLKAKYGDLYGAHNVLISATHTHVAPGGTSGHLMVDLTTLGFRPVTFEANVQGIVNAIVRAHEDIAPSELTLTKGQVVGGSVNRSKAAWEKNPQKDRDANPDGIDRNSITLHIFREGQSVGFINWFSVHATSMGHTYRHIGTDNKGYAAWATEEAMGVDHRHPESAPYVAAFAQASPGDQTPNLGLTPGSGPGKDDTSHARIMGERIMAAVDGSDTVEVTAGNQVRGTFQWVDCSNIQVDAKWTSDGKPGKTGPAILGAAFAASSQEDGGGEPMLGFNEGMRGGTPWVQALNKVTVPPEIMAIHAPKEMLLPLGYVEGMIQQVHPFYIHRIGGLTLISHGFEATITSGLRLRRVVAEALNVSLDSVVSQGYTNGYGHYVATPEEYSTQNYEGGATIFGRNELPAFQQVFDGLARALKNGDPVDHGKPAGDLTGMIPQSPSGNTWADFPPPGKKFGDILEAPSTVTAGETVTVKLVGANPNNNLRLGEGYFTVEKSDGTVVANDSSESTLITFANNMGQTTVTLDWNSTGYDPGTYTLRYKGDSRTMFGHLDEFEAVSTVQVL
ncbi:N-acylsphingosine amidohydrolase [Corynebacterium sp. 4HC-13]|uniref:Neutral ceramidase n=2 Tax=Corynebacterium anserum TaxID=2684406 RepID=A0A7G7YR34_9CORY|nr:N-acylsphingosine amidohydrolase [Corynebacterium anserum]QNH96954.1 N-acylsphingosine amidohydrolase [Corynebacterium anserum]